jgi:hypothetical protein
VLRFAAGTKICRFSRAKWFPDFSEAAGNFLMQTGLIETVREKLRGVSSFTAPRPVR